MRTYIVEPWPPDSTHAWPSEDQPKWVVRIEWSLKTGRFAPVGLHVEPADPKNPQPITTRELRALPLGRLCEQVLADRRRQLADSIDELKNAEGLDPEDLESAAGIVKELEREAHSYAAPPNSRKGGRTPDYGEDFYRQVAECYRGALAVSTKPTRAVAQRWQTSDSSAGRWVHKARRLGMLPPTSQGRACADPWEGARP